MTHKLILWYNVTEESGLNNINEMRMMWLDKDGCRYKAKKSQAHK